MNHLFFLIIGTCLAISADAEIHEVISIDEVKQWFDEADPNTLVIFDMDYTLVMPQNPAFHRPVYRQYTNWRRELTNTLTSHEKTLIAAVFITNGPLSLVEPQTAPVIAALQNRRIPLIILTHSAVGTIGTVAQIEDWRYEELLRLGIDINCSFIDKNPTQFGELNSQRGYYPLFKNGILLTNGHSNTKGEVLTAFLKLVEWTPSKVIFIDDELNNLHSVETTLSALGVQYIGIHYKGPEHVPYTEISEEDVKKAWIDVVQKTKTLATEQT